MTGLSPRETSRFFADRFVRWSRWEIADVQPAVTAYREYCAAFDSLRELRGKPVDNAERLRHAARGARFLDARQAAACELSEIVGAGLASREGTCLLRRAGPASIPLV